MQRTSYSKASAHALSPLSLFLLLPSSVGGRKNSRNERRKITLRFLSAPWHFLSRPPPPVRRRARAPVRFWQPTRRAWTSPKRNKFQIRSLLLFALSDATPRVQHRGESEPRLHWHRTTAVAPLRRCASSSLPIHTPVPPRISCACMCVYQPARLSSKARLAELT